MVKGFVTRGIGVVDSPVTIQNFLGDDQGFDQFIVAPTRRYTV
jgi:hypothetical protein